MFELHRTELDFSNVTNREFPVQNVEFTLLNKMVKEVIIKLKVLYQHQLIALKFEEKYKPLNSKPARKDICQ